MFLVSYCDKVLPYVANSITILTSLTFADSGPAEIPPVLPANPFKLLEPPTAAPASVSVSNLKSTTVSKIKIHHSKKN